MYNPEIWGPGAWLFLHTITLNYPTNPTFEDKENYKNFFISLKNVIPCKNCAKHYSENLNNFPIDDSLNSKEDLVKWLIDNHNKVNVKNKKRKYSYNEVIEKYEKLYSPKSNCFMILAVIVLILFGIYFFKRIIKEIK
tara:strand:+ start:225 stop:638 length:414 start_codon:yes stop_codon:yes gene_type:complete